jgi:hypothetical protein
MIFGYLIQNGGMQQAPINAIMNLDYFGSNICCCQHSQPYIHTEVLSVYCVLESQIILTVPVSNNILLLRHWRTQGGGLGGSNPP